VVVVGRQHRGPDRRVPLDPLGLNGTQLERRSARRDG
jgi:hypothetical protein